MRRSRKRFRLGESNIKPAYRPIPGQGNHNELHIFDFDETLGNTAGATLHVGVEKTPSGWQPIDNYAAQMKGAIQSNDVFSWNEAIQKGLIGPGLQQQLSQYIDSSGKLSNTFKDPNLHGCEVVFIGTEGYKHFKILVGNGGLAGVGAQRPVIWATHPKALNNPNAQVGEELHIIDYSPASSLGQAAPIDLNIRTADINQKEKDRIGIVTARKGQTAMDSLAGKGTVKASNISDMKGFIDQQGLAPFDFIYGAADVDNDGAINKASYIKNAWLRGDEQDLYFYDDDINNIQAVEDYLLNDPDILKFKPGARVNLYHDNPGPRWKSNSATRHRPYKQYTIGTGQMRNQPTIKGLPDPTQDPSGRVAKNLRKMRGIFEQRRRIRSRRNALIIAETVKYLASNSSQRKVLRENCHKSKGRMLDYGHQRSDSGEGKMTKAKLFRMAQMAQRLHDKIFGYDDLPEWVQDKITTAEDRLKTAHDYMLYKIWRMENEQV